MLFICFMFVLKLLTINATIEMSFDDYPRYATVTQYLSRLRKTFPDRVNLFTIGRTIEGREIVTIKISCRICTSNVKKPAILLDAGIHGREWMAPLTALYIINELVTNEENSNMLTNVDWYIIPVLNPDGYEYTFETERYWRKNRRKGPLCDGVDLNRNFGFQWRNGSEGPCSEIYEGERKNSEPEIRALQTLALKLNGQIKLYLSMHTYGPFIIYPWAYTTDDIYNYQEHKNLAINVAMTIERTRGTMYKIGTVGELLYAAPGSSLDWMVGVAKVPLGYVFELPESTEVFDPPIQERLNISIETFEGFKVLHKYIENKWRFGDNNLNSYNND